MLRSRSKTISGADPPWHTQVTGPLKLLQAQMVGESLPSQLRKIPALLLTLLKSHPLKDSNPRAIHAPP